MTINSELFRTGDKVNFVYHDKVRTGVVETVDSEFVRLELDKGNDTDPAVKYKSFKYGKIQRVNNVVTTIQ